MLTHHYFPHIGGNGVQCKLLSEELYKSGYRITVVTKKFRRGLPSREVINGIDVLRIFCLSAIFKKSVCEYLYDIRPGNLLGKFLTKALARLFFYIDELVFVVLACFKIVRLKNSIDIIHVHQSHWIAYCGAIAARRIKRHLIVKDATLDGFKELQVMPFSGIMRESIIESAYFAAISSDIYKSLLLNGIPKDRIFMVPNGVQLPSLENCVVSENFDILFVGNFNQGRIKGLDVLIKAVPAVLQKYPALRLFVLGKGDASPYLKLMQELQIPPHTIEFMGRLDPKKYYSNCAIFVLPSRSEGMSNALLEAMSYGMTCVSTNVSGSNDLIINQRNGLLIEPDNISQLENALLFLFADREQALLFGRNARETIVTNFQMDKAATQYANIYKIILEK